MKILIENFEFEAIIGVLDIERVTPQRVVINLEIDYNYKNGDYLDYAKIIKEVKEHIQIKQYLLLEDAINGVFKLLKELFPNIDFIECKISKPDISKECIVSIQEKRKF